MRPVPAALLAALGSLALQAGPALAQDTWAVDKAHSEVSFQIRHFVSKVRGRFTDFSGTVLADPARPEASSVEFAIKSASIDTDHEGRDKHLRSGDFFDVEKFPEITFKSAKVVAKGKDSYDVSGTLTMRGVSKEVTLPVAYLGSVPTKDREGKEGAKAGLEASITLNRRDYGIVWNRMLDTGPMLADEVLVSISLEMNRQPKPTN